MILTDYQPAAQRDEHPLAEELRTIITTTEATKPRSLQTAIGPSELGEPCLRRLAYKLMSEPTANTNIDPWAAIIGTSVHTWLADAFTAATPAARPVHAVTELITQSHNRHQPRTPSHRATRWPTYHTPN